MASLSNNPLYLPSNGSCPNASKPIICCENMFKDKNIEQISDEIKKNLIFINLEFIRFRITKKKSANLKSNIDLKNIKFPITLMLIKDAIIEIIKNKKIK
jgi:hypothetical protein